MTRQKSGPRIYRYVHVSDDGMAPCSDKGVVSLATCKPTIRRVAHPGDWVIGFYPTPWDPGTVSWAARISETIDHMVYQAGHERRADAVYGQGSDGKPIRLRADYHPGQKDMDKDLSAPVLIFDPAATWYFGDNPAQLPNTLLHLAASGQGHRVNFRRPGDLQGVVDWLTAIGAPGIYGRPRHEEGCVPCTTPQKPVRTC